VSSLPALITISAAGCAETVERAIGVATELAAAGLPVQILAFDDFSGLINDAGIRFCSAPGDLAGFEACAHGSIASSRYLASAVPGIPMTLDGRLRDSTMIVLCDDSPLIPSIAEARGLPIYRVLGSIGEVRLEARGVQGWLESVRAWRAVRVAVNDMRMFLGLPDFTSPRSFRRSIVRIPIFEVEAVVPLQPQTTPLPVQAVIKLRQSA
jgi:hypothetical protein